MSRLVGPGGVVIEFHYLFPHEVATLRRRASYHGSRKARSAARRLREWERRAKPFTYSVDGGDVFEG